MRNKHPYFSIITPSFNQGQFIQRTIDSVLSQRFPGLEYLVIDGGSTDNTVQILESFGDVIGWVSERDRGQAHAVNKGLVAARGDVIGWLNSDDVYYPGSLQAVHDFLEANPDVNILYGMADHIDEHDNIIESYYNEEWDYERLKNVCYICQPAVFFRRSIVDTFGLLDEGLRYCMDYEYWLRIGKENPMHYLKRKLAGSRLHESTKTLGSAVGVHEEILRMFKAKLRVVPNAWLFAHAHVVARAEGLSESAADLRFLRRIIAVSAADALRLLGYIPFSMIRTYVDWIVSGLKTRYREKMGERL